MRITDRAVRNVAAERMAALWRRVDPDGGSSKVGVGRMMPDRGRSLSFDDL